MHVEQVNIRRANASDARSLAKLMQQLGYPTTTLEMEERLKGIISHGDYHTLVADISGRVVGMIGVRIAHFYEKNGVYGQIVALIVDQAYRGQRIGSALLTEGEYWCHGRGVQVIVVNSGNSRLAAHRFYEQSGYQATGVRFVKTMGESNP